MSKNLNQTSLKVNNSYNQIFSIALPIAIAMLIPQLNHLINNIFLGQYNQLSLGNAGITGVYYLIFAVIGNGLGSAIQSVLSFFAGAGDESKFKKIFSQSIILIILLAFIGIVFTHFVTPFLFNKLENSNNSKEIISFLKIRIWGLPFLYLFLIGNSYLVTTLNTKLLLIASLVETIANIFFDYGLIFGHFGMPKLGFNGAAYASVIAEAFAAFTVMIVMYYSGIKKRFNLKVNLNYDKVIFNKIFKSAGPLIMQYVLSITTWFVFFIIIQKRNIPGEMPITNIMRNVFGLVGVFVWSIGATTNNMVSNLRGQNKINEIKSLLNKLSIISISTVCITSCILLFNVNAFFNLFHLQTNTIKDAKEVIYVVCTAMFLMSLAVIWLNALVGLGKPLINLTVEIISIFIYLGYSIYIGIYLRKSLAWCWSNEGVYWVLGLTLSFIFANKIINKEIQNANTFK